MSDRPWGDPQRSGWGSPAPPPPPPPPGGAGAGLRPLNTGDVLDGMFRLFLRHWRTYLAAVAVIAIPTQFVVALLQRDLVAQTGLMEVITDPTAAQAATAGGPGLNEFVASVSGGWAVGLLITPLITGIACVLGARAHIGEPLATGEALRLGARRYAPLVIANLLAYVAVIVGAALFIAPMVGLLFAGVLGESVLSVFAGLVLGLIGFCAGVTIYTLLIIAPVVVMVEELGPLASLRRSSSLVRRRFWGVLGIAVLATIISGLIGMVVSWPVTIPAMLFGGNTALVLTTLGAIVSVVITAPLVPNALALLYFDLRVRGEALDLEAMTAAVEATDEGRHPA